MGYRPIRHASLDCGAELSGTGHGVGGSEATPDFTALVRTAAAAVDAAMIGVAEDDTACDTTAATPPFAESDRCTALTSLWRAAFDLPGWLLMATDIDGVARPHVRHDGGRGHVLAFTDEFAALRRQAELGMTFRLGFMTIQIEVDRALQMVESLAGSGATDLLFNDGAVSFSAPIAMLQRLHRHVEHGDDPAALAATTLRVGDDAAPIGPLLSTASRDPAARTDAMTALLSLTDWWFVCNPQQPDAFHVRRFAMPRDDRTVQAQAVVAFTAHRLAMEATERYGLADPDGSIVLMQMPVQDAVQWLQSFRDHDVETVMFDALTTPFPVRIKDLPGEWRDRHPGGETTPPPPNESSSA